MNLCISLDEHDLETLRRRAERTSAGDISAAIADMIRTTRDREQRDARAAWLGEAPPDSGPRLEALRADWGTPLMKPRRRRARSDAH